MDYLCNEFQFSVHVTTKFFIDKSCFLIYGWSSSSQDVFKSIISKEKYHVWNDMHVCGEMFSTYISIIFFYDHKPGESFQLYFSTIDHFTVCNYNIQRLIFVYQSSFERHTSELLIQWTVGKYKFKPRFSFVRQVKALFVRPKKRVKKEAQISNVFRFPCFESFQSYLCH